MTQESESCGGAIAKAFSALIRTSKVADDTLRLIPEFDALSPALANTAKVGGQAADDVSSVVGNAAKSGGQVADEIVGDVMQVIPKLGDDVLQVQDDIAKAMLQGATVARGANGLTRADQFLKFLARGSQNVPEELLPLLDDIGEFAMDTKLQTIIGKAMSRATTRGVIADPIFWKQVIKYATEMKHTKNIDDIASSTIKGLKEFEPDQLIALQRIADESVRKLYSYVDDAIALSDVAVSPIALNVQKTLRAGDIFQAAGNRLKELTQNFHKHLKNSISKPEVRLGDETLTQMLDKYKHSDKAFKESEAALENAVKSGSSADELSTRLHDMIEKSKAVGQVLDEIEPVAISKGIMQTSDGVSTAWGNVMKTPWRDTLQSIMNDKITRYAAYASGILAASAVGSSIVYDYYEQQYMTREELEARDEAWRLWLENRNPYDGSMGDIADYDDNSKTKEQWIMDELDKRDREKLELENSRKNKPTTLVSTTTTTTTATPEKDETSTDVGVSNVNLETLQEILDAINGKSKSRTSSNDYDRGKRSLLSDFEDVEEDIIEMTTEYIFLDEEVVKFIVKNIFPIIILRVCFFIYSTETEEFD